MISTTRAKRQRQNVLVGLFDLDQKHDTTARKQHYPHLNESDALVMLPSLSLFSTTTGSLPKRWDKTSFWISTLRLMEFPSYFWLFSNFSLSSLLVLKKAPPMRKMSATESSDSEPSRKVY